jgi:hypothetical protein
MSITKFETSFPFPILKVTSLIQHTEVSKPTGISYIILVLINESTNKRTKLSDLLVQFGVPYELHGIFADEINKLIHELEIIKCAPYEYNRLHFAEYLVGNFVFTEKGKKVFKEELIPASKSIESKQELFYDPVHNTLMDKVPLDWKIGKIVSSVLPIQFAEKFDYYDHVELEEYLDSVKGKGIVIKKDEVIIDVKIMSNEYFYTTFPVVFFIDNKKRTINFEFPDNPTQVFFEKHYDNSLISEALAIKRKFNFNGKKPAMLDGAILDNAQLLLPEQYEEILSKSTPLVISKTNYLPKQTEHVLKSSTLISKIIPIIETIHVYGPDIILAYAPVLVSLENKSGNGPVSMFLLTEHSLNGEAKQLITEGIFEEIQTYSIDHAKDGLYIFKQLNDQKDLIRLFEKYLSGDIEESISRLKEIKDTNDISFIKDWFRQKAQSLFDRHFSVVLLGTVEHQYALGSWLIKYLNIPDISMINKIVESNHKVDPMKLFVLLESLNYVSSEIFAQVNVFDVFIQAALNNDKINTSGSFSNQIKTIQMSLNKLKELTGMKDAHQFVIKEDINRVQFQEVYSGFASKYSELLKYDKYGSSAFEKLKEYHNNLKYLNNLFVEEKSAASNPKNIDQKFIVSKINKGDHFSAIIYLSAKLEWILKNQYKMTGTLEAMINGLLEEESLKPFVSDLHQFRRTRNGLVHPKESVTKIDSNIVTKWTNIVFTEVMKA